MVYNLILHRICMATGGNRKTNAIHFYSFRFCKKNTISEYWLKNKICAARRHETTPRFEMQRMQGQTPSKIERYLWRK